MFEHLAVWHFCSAKKKQQNVRNFTKVFQSDPFITTVLIDTIDLHHFLPFSVTVTLVEGHKVREEYACVIHCLAHFYTC